MGSRSYNIRKYGLKLSISEIAAAIADGLGINQQDMDGCTLLHYAAEDALDKYDRLPVVAFLIAQGADPHLASHSIHGKGKGPTPLQLAQKSGRQDLVHCMVEACERS
jgi:ankyrin repeat protein